MHPNEIREKLIQTLDSIIENGRWGSSLFLKNLLKRIEAMRAKLLAKLTASTASSTVALLAATQKEGYQRVYIELYQASCENIENWAKTLKSLTEHFVSRPVYRMEADVQELVRTKHSRTDAYVTVWVKQSDIIPSSGEVLKDRLGHELLKLRENSVQLENIIEFVHDKITYVLEAEQLVLKK